jgi:hypothetical protein
MWFYSNYHLKINSFYSDSGIIFAYPNNSIILKNSQFLNNNFSVGAIYLSSSLNNILLNNCTFSFKDYIGSNNGIISSNSGNKFI